MPRTSIIDRKLVQHNHEWLRIFLAIGVFGMWNSSNASTAETVSSKCTVGLYGDSILRGAYVAVKNGKEVAGRWERHPAAEIVAQRPAYVVDDRTVSAQPLSVMSAQFVAENLPRIVVLGSGIAEGWFGGPIAEPLEKLVIAIRDKGSIPIITGYSRQIPNKYMSAKKMAGRDRADRDARALALRLNVQFADIGAVGPVEIIDDVHPTQAYSLRLTNQLIAALDRVAPECVRNADIAAGF